MQIPINQRKRVKGKSFFSLFGIAHPPTALGRTPENAPKSLRNMCGKMLSCVCKKPPWRIPKGFGTEDFCSRAYLISIEDGTE